METPEYGYPRGCPCTPDWHHPDCSYHGDKPKCLDAHKGNCQGEVKLRESLSGTGTPIPRCDFHWDKRLDFQQDHNRRYPMMAPRDFDPMDAGESWDEDY